MDDALLLDKADGVATITMNRPDKLNALSRELWVEMSAILTELRHDDDTRVIVLTGAGRGFCAGADLEDLSHGLQRHTLDEMNRVSEVPLGLHDMPQPSIAKVNGPAVGGGCNLALMCDFVIAGESATFCQIFVRRALSIDVGGSWVLPRLVGMRKAKELALLGTMVGAAEAHELGMVNRVVADDELDAAVAELASTIAALPPLAVKQTKALLNDSYQKSLLDCLHGEAMAQAVCFGSEDGREAVRAFVEKRPPHFIGR